MKEVCIVDQEINHQKRYQIMTRTRFGFNHVFPGKLFTLDEAKDICNQHGFTVVSIGDIWQCTK